MKLIIALFAGLICANPHLHCNGEKVFQQEFAEGITVRQLRDLLGIDEAIPLLIFVNNHSESDDWVLVDGDRVALFPLIGGG